MATSTTFYIPWDCDDCGETNIIGPEKFCPECKKPRTYFELYDADQNINVSTQPTKGSVITDADQLRKAHAGADNSCNNCDANNPANETHCWRCSMRIGATHEEMRKDSGSSYKGFKVFEKGEDGDHAGRDRSFLIDSFGPHQGREALRGNGEIGEDYSVVEEAKKQREWKRPTRKKASTKAPRGPYDGPNPNNDPYAQSNTYRPVQNTITPKMMMIGGGVAFVLLSIVFLIWGFSSHEVQGKVTSMNWTRSEQVQKFLPTVDSDWRYRIHQSSSRMPVNGRGERAGAQIISCHQKHYNDERYQCGTRSVQKSRRVSDGQTCRTVRIPERCSTRSNGNGTATRTCSGGGTRQECRTKYRTEYYNEDVPKYCTRPIYKSHCSYNTYRWRGMRNKVVSGTGHKLFWPKLVPSTHERVLRNGAYYVHIQFTDDDEVKNKEMKYTNSGQYLSWEQGQRITAEVTNFGSINDIKELNQLPKE